MTLGLARLNILEEEDEAKTKKNHKIIILNPPLVLNFIANIQSD